MNRIKMDKVGSWWWASQWTTQAFFTMKTDAGEEEDSTVWSQNMDVASKTRWLEICSTHKHQDFRFWQHLTTISYFSIILQHTKIIKDHIHIIHAKYLCSPSIHPLRVINPFGQLVRVEGTMPCLVLSLAQDWQDWQDPMDPTKLKENNLLRLTYWKLRCSDHSIVTCLKDLNGFRLLLQVSCPLFCKSCRTLQLHVVLPSIRTIVVLLSCPTT